jgi:hypothetical protein
MMPVTMPDVVGGSGFDQDAPVDEPGESNGPAATAAAGAEHLQAAGREFLAAARSLLDAVEEVVEDRARLGELAESFTGFLGELAETARGDRTPWGRAVRVEDPVPPAAGPDSGPDAGPDSGSDSGPDSGSDAGTEGGAPVDGGPPPEPGRPRSGRVRRIPLD